MEACKDKKEYIGRGLLGMGGCTDVVGETVGVVS